MFNHAFNSAFKLLGQVTPTMMLSDSNKNVMCAWLNYATSCNEMYTEVLKMINTYNSRKDN